jgi:hypothetical protein
VGGHGVSRTRGEGAALDGHARGAQMTDEREPQIAQGGHAALRGRLRLWSPPGRSTPPAPRAATHRARGRGARQVVGLCPGSVPGVHHLDEVRATHQRAREHRPTAVVTTRIENAQAESFFKTLKSEEVYPSPQEAAPCYRAGAAAPDQPAAAGRVAVPPGGPAPAAPTVGPSGMPRTAQDRRSLRRTRMPYCGCGRSLTVPDCIRRGWRKESET